MSEASHKEVMENYKSCFAVGCFNFTPRNPTPTFDPFEFSDDIRECLESVPMITNLHLEGFDGVRGFPPYDAVDIQRGPGLGFHPTPSEIAFDIFVPLHIQERMLHGHVHSEGEHFRVRVFYTYDFAATIVEPLDEFTEHPSEAVIVVRKCLEDHFRSAPKSVVDFQSLGPSPFHADFFIFGDRGEIDSAGCTIASRRGTIESPIASLAQTSPKDLPCARSCLSKWSRS